MTKWIYGFGDGAADGNAGMKELLGGKGANLAEMSNLGLPVPPGFTVTTEVCNAFYRNDRAYPEDLKAQVEPAITAVEKQAGAKFGDPDNPLLLSVRSGSRASMPGMMDSVLNLGLNDRTVEGLARMSGDRRFALDSYRRFIQMYADVVLGVDNYYFEDLLAEHKELRGFNLDTDLGIDDWEGLLSAYKDKVTEVLGKPFPQDPHDQLWGAIGAVFGSWMNDRARTYRHIHHIPASWGTAVNIQAMVFGNMGDDSATGVAFTRDPSTGERTLFGEYLVNAQGEDVVAGIRTPQSLTRAARERSGSSLPSMEEIMPDGFAQLVAAYQSLEAHYRDMQDLEFTVQKGKLWMLQTRTGKRTAKAALKIVVDMTAEGLITPEEAVMRVDPAALEQLLHPMLDPDAERKVIARGLPASPGAASGEVVFDAEDAVRVAATGRKVVLMRTETSPEDIQGMHAAAGIVTSRGGMTSHAAVVARGMGRPCVSGAGTIRIDIQTRTATVGDFIIAEGDVVTLDGATGEVMIGEVATVQPELTGDFGTLMVWADKVRRMRIRTNAETPEDARVARRFGAEGIGLCRTEHMFFDPARILAVREMILAEDGDGRRVALEKILPMQRADFADLFRVMSGLPVTIRLLDPPLHEFLPKTEADLKALSAATGIRAEAVRKRAIMLEETNPMLGHRGCRLGISFPEIYEMQTRAIFEAALDVKADGSATPIPEIMIPLIATRREFDVLKPKIVAVADTVFAERGDSVEYQIGTMIELPRAALRAAEIAESAEFFSFGTNDLTQTTFGISRDDSGIFLDDYLHNEIFDQDPFVTIDKDGVGELMRWATERGRATSKDLKLGICGEHGGDPESVRFCEALGLDYVSCSPYRVPVARLAAAQAVLQPEFGPDSTA
jgi:pyruvate,orthophosphate dikinase